MENKICSRCKESKPLSAFSKNKNVKSGFSCWCKDCIRGWRERNKEHIRAYHKGWMERRAVKEA